jgi:methyl-accepting chemotaxis protein
MSQNHILVKNENEANRFASKVMLYTIAFVVLVYLLDVAGIFIVPVDTMTIAMSLAAICLALPAIIVFGFKKQDKWVKFVITTAASVMVFIITILLSWHAVLMFVFPLAISSLYFSRKLSWYTAILSLVSQSFAQYLSLSSVIKDQNLSTPYEMVVYGIAPRAIEFMAISIIIIILSKRTRNMLRNVMGAEEQADLLNRMLAVTNKAKEVSGVLSESVRKLSIITDSAAKANEQIAENTQKIASGTESTVRFMDVALTEVANISGNLNRIAQESTDISQISQQMRMLNEDSGKAIQSAAREMLSISEATIESKELVARLKEKSIEISRFAEIITGISEQTNMLALNAAIESARAGEQGRGFAVVAGEIRNLAEQSQKAASDISDLIVEINVDTEKASNAMDTSATLVSNGLGIIKEAGSTFGRLSEFGARMYGRIAEVSAETGNAAASSNQMVELVEEIKAINSKNLAELHEIAAAVEQQLASMQQVTSSVSSIEGMANELLETVNN